MKKTILIVEDSLTQAMILENDLQSHDYHVALAADGKKALEWLSTNTPDLVISDIMMPEMNGFELCRQIKILNQQDEIPVILLTSLSGTDEVIEGLNAGADSFISKPYDKNYLISHIAKVVNEKTTIVSDKKAFGAEIIFEGKKRFIQTDQQQIIKFLMNIYEGAIQQNIKLIKSQEQLQLMNENLESLVEERTEKLETQFDLLEALINSPINLIIFSLDHKYCYTTFNNIHRQEMKKIWNADIEVGNSILEYMHNPVLRSMAKSSIDRALCGEFFTEIQHQPGAEIYYEFSWSPITHDENITGVTVFVNDISDRKRKEVEIDDKNKQLNTLNAEKDKLFSIIAHDLRSPISAFTALTQYMVEELSEISSEEFARMITSMWKSSNNIYNLLNNLLEWSKLQQGQIPFNPTQLKLQPLVNDSLEILFEMAKNKEVLLVNAISNDIEVLVDSQMFQTVIRNLASNALKFTTKGGKITISAVSEYNGIVRISIADTGIGMGPEIINNLFNLKENTNRKGTDGEPSSGLGLTLCKEFIEKNGGKLFIESELGKGSTFHFTLPGH